MKLFRVLVVTTTPQRLANLIRGTERTSRAFWFATIDDIGRQGVLHHVWERLGGESRSGLLD
jgi:hypothetical protein